MFYFSNHPTNFITYDIHHQGHRLTLIDSGGVYFEKNKEKTPFQDEIEEKVTQTLQTVSNVWMIVDGKEGLHPLDQHIAKIIRKHKNVTLVVNKVDQIEKKNLHAHFYKLGLGDPFCVSATQGQGLKALLDQMIQGLPKKQLEEGSQIALGQNIDQPIKLSIVGRPNVGKSSLINHLIDQDRLIVSEQAGTTRDIVEVPFNWNKQSFLLLDTAGLKKTFKKDQGADYYAAVRSMKAIKETDVVMVLLSAEDPLSRQDKRIIKQAIDAQKPMLIFVNKWDLMEDQAPQFKRELKKKLINHFDYLKHIPILFGSTKKKISLDQIFKSVDLIKENHNKRIATADLNRFVDRVIHKQPPQTKSGKLIKVFYATQVEVEPPLFVFFISHKEKITQNYERFIENQIRTFLDPFVGSPVLVKFKAKSEDRNVLK